MIPLPASFQETIHLGQELHRQIPQEIDGAERNDWGSESVDPIILSVRKYFSLVSRTARWLGIFAFAPTILVILLSLSKSIGRGLMVAYLVYLIALVAAFAWVASSMIGIVGEIRRLPEAIFQKMLIPLWGNIELFHLASSVGLFFYIIPPWQIITSIPIVALITILWLGCPWLLVLTRRETAFVLVKVAQLTVLIIAAFFIASSPVPMSHYQRWAQRRSAELLRPEEQKEVTSSWRSLQWFTQEGQPKIWVSGNGDRGYRLYTTPGHDPDTNEKLLSVSTEAQKLVITSYFDSKESEQQQAAAALKHQELVNKFIVQRARREPIRRIPRAFTVVDGDGQIDRSLSLPLAAILLKEGYTNCDEILSPDFFATGFFRENGTTASHDHFLPADFIEKALCVRVVTSFKQESSIDESSLDVVDISISLEVVSILDNTRDTVSSFQVKGVGFSRQQALENAIPRATKRIHELLPGIRNAMSAIR